MIKECVLDIKCAYFLLVPNTTLSDFDVLENWSKYSEKFPTNSLNQMKILKTKITKIDPNSLETKILKISTYKLHNNQIY